MGIVGKFLSVLLVLAAGFLFGYRTAVMIQAGAPLVTVRVVNESGKTVAPFRLMYGNSVVTVDELADGASYLARFYAPAETSYRVEADFADGTLIEAGPRYIEPGISAIETIKESEITTMFTARFIP